ncbi:MAG: nucleotidyltransferase domain-containing protein [Anaerolineae bacterium]|uniref:nucleotidyltransferase domain-containing protein n=1 Tax=Candidatus Amarolinea dominans TaxID=3140696 RepID=UPI001D6228C1|nr:nucleotidyltransferase domain-containing protein [Anaerolineae bacterium]MBK7201717.1 nucleotidyltransferase domain-containing protein [Anaerolineae bacterium]MBK9092619.1 nucleotidyltransferase domain-containing protein [Anaerolineae bacterium]MBK9230700.1 nucleotidyltransferase domain-containing protein [Anaerolineae bacterium]
MAEIPNHVRRIIAQYLTSLRDHGFQIQDAILFGSYASGQANQWSDIDLALVSSEFEGIRFADKNKIRKITISISTDLEVLPFNPKDFTPSNPLVKEILDTGIRVVRWGVARP